MRRIRSRMNATDTDESTSCEFCACLKVYAETLSIILTCISKPVAPTRIIRLFDWSCRNKCSAAVKMNVLANYLNVLFYYTCVVLIIYSLTEADTLCAE